MNDEIVKELRELSDSLPDPAILARGFDEVPAAIVMIDEQGDIYFINRQTELLFGYLREEVLGGPLSQLVPEELRARHDEHLKRYMLNPRSRSMGVGLQLKGRKKNGATFSVEINLGPFRTKKGLFVVATIVVKE